MTIQQLTVGSIGTNCYLLLDDETGAAAVVDPGGSADDIASAVSRAGAKVEMILLTHGHFDHTGAVEKLRALWPGVPVYLHAADRAMLGDPIMPPLKETADYGEGDVLSLGSLKIQVLHTPGHTPGGVCLLVGDTLFSGDTLFAGSMGRTDFEGGDEAALFASLKRLGELPGDLQVLPGHMGASTLERERRTNPYLRMAMGR